MDRLYFLLDIGKWQRGFVLDNQHLVHKTWYMGQYSCNPYMLGCLGTRSWRYMYLIKV